EFVRGVQILEKEGDGFISAGELRDVSTRLGDRATPRRRKRDGRVDEERACWIMSCARSP
ncbi:hypothetical protein M407DRAFT_84014, partial [Tulasnella calospora MUT 4182]